LQWYIAIIREATEARKPKLSLAEQAASGEGRKERKVCIIRADYPQISDIPKFHIPWHIHLTPELSKLHIC
jgi:hypothetical protein